MPYATRDTYVAAAGQVEFDCNFPFLDASHVKVLVSGVPAPFVWVGPSRVRLVYPATAGAAVILKRETPLDQALVTFQNGAVLTEQELNTAVRQTLFVQQELADLYNGALTEAQVRLGSNLGIVTDPDAIMDELTGLVLADDLLAEFRQRISDIDLNAETIIAQTTRVNSLEALVDSLANVDLGNLSTIIQSESTQRIAGDTALAQTIALMGARSGDNLSFVLDLTKVMAKPGESLAQRFATLSAEDANARALILDERTARTTALEAEANLRMALGTRMTTAEGGLSSLTQRVVNTESSISDERTTRSAADAAEALARQALAARVSTTEGTLGNLGPRLTTAEAAIVSNQSAQAGINTAQAGTNTSLAARVTTTEGTLGNLGPRVTSAEGLIQTNAQVQAGVNSAFASQFTLLGAKNANGTAWLLDESKVLVNGGSQALGTRLSGIDTRIGDNYSAVINKINADTGPNSSLAQSINAVTGRLGSAESSITTLSQVTNGLSAKWSVAVNTNGHVSGILFNATGATSSFTVAANVFAVVDPNGGNPIVPFEVSGGVVRAPTLVVGNLFANTIQGWHIVNGAVGTGSIATNAVSATVATSGNYNGVYGNNGTNAEVCSIQIYCNGGPVLIQGMYSFMLSAGPGNINSTCQLTRDGAFLVDSGAYAPRGYRCAMPVAIVDNPGVGWHTYRINDTVGAGATIAFYAYTLSATELKR